MSCCSESEASEALVISRKWAPTMFFTVESFNSWRACHGPSPGSQHPQVLSPRVQPRRVGCFLDLHRIQRECGGLGRGRQVRQHQQTPGRQEVFELHYGRRERRRPCMYVPPVVLLVPGTARCPRGRQCRDVKPEVLQVHVRSTCMGPSNEHIYTRTHDFWLY